MVKRHPALASTPLPTADEDMIVTVLWFPIWPHNSNILMRDKLQTTTGFVLNKKQTCHNREPCKRGNHYKQNINMSYFKLGHPSPN